MFGIHKIIDIPVTRYAIDSPRSCTLFFQNAYALTVYDTPHYESSSSTASLSEVFATMLKGDATSRWHSNFASMSSASNERRLSVSPPVVYLESC
jgi:hypothetical protein